ncbi:hypothetical protein [Nonomuraea candida]|uniref:hypothetical protein n=1 Tax=Nonomuraea candida TaxID=359159 RepID=UPI0005B9131B|nr:hypothetical protein [Nonomuraea candida]
MNHAYAAARLLVHLTFTDTAVMTAHTGRRFTPDRATVEWMWTPRQGWAYKETIFEGPTVPEDQTPGGLLALPDRGFYRALPDQPRGSGHEPPAEYEPLVEGSRPAWMPPGVCLECRRTTVNVTEQLNHRTGEVEPLCPHCHHMLTTDA